MPTKRRDKELARIHRAQAASVEWALFVSIIKKRMPHIFKDVSSSRDFRKLGEDDREAVRSVLLEEFCATGLRPDSEPNERGIAIERLIAKLAKVA